LIERLLRSPIIDLAIMVDVVQMGMEIDYSGTTWDKVWLACSAFSALTYFLEMVLSINLYGRLYFKKASNICDFLAVWLCIADVGVKIMHFNSSARIEVVMKIMRMTRLLRIIRLLHLFPGFRVIITTMFDSLQAIMWLLLFLLLTTYVVSIICTQSLGTKNVGFPGFDDSAEVAYRTEVAGFNNFRYFGTVWKSMISLFHLSMVTDEMTIIIRATNEIYPVATLGLMLFILVVTLGILNTIIGIIVEKTVCVLRVQEADKRKSKLQQLDTIDNLCELMRMIDSDGNSCLDTR